MMHAQDGLHNYAPAWQDGSGVAFSCRRSAIILNNDAIVLLLTSVIDDEKARKILKLGLICVKYDLFPARSTGLDELHSGLSPVETNSPSLCNSLDHSHVVHFVPVSLPSPKSLGDSFYLYSNAFTFRSSNQEGESHPSLPIDAEILSATIIYNIALVLNIKALQTNCSILQRRSLKLYEMSVGLINSMIIHESEEKKMYSVLSTSRKNNATRLAIACSNNMAQLAFLQGNFERARTMLNTLEYLLSAGSVSSNGQDVSLLFHDDDMSGFKLNIMFMYPPTTASLA